MRIKKIADVSSDIHQRHYDIAFFASGYEQRSTYIPKLLNIDRVKKAVIFGYKEGRTEFHREDNDRYFVSDWKQEPIIADDNDDTVIYDQLRALEVKENSELRVLVDYSTMSRLWSASILNWARFLTYGASLKIDFLYAFGSYKGDFRPLIIEDILAIPGYEGSPISDAPSLAIFGLGFDGVAALAALDQLEPNIVYAYLASPGAAEDYPDKAKNCNKTLINHYVKEKLLELPISSVEMTFRSLTELISPHRGKTNIILIPMGPKPHVLAAMLLCLRFEKEMTCLRVRGKREPRVDVEAVGRIVATCVHFEPEESA